MSRKDPSYEEFCNDPGVQRLLERIQDAGAVTGRDVANVMFPEFADEDAEGGLEQE